MILKKKRVFGQLKTIRNTKKEKKMNIIHT